MACLGCVLQLGIPDFWKRKIERLQSPTSPPSLLSTFVTQVWLHSRYQGNKVVRAALYLFGLWLSQQRGPRNSSLTPNRSRTCLGIVSLRLGEAFLKPDLTKEQFGLSQVLALHVSLEGCFWLSSLFILHLEIDSVSFFPNLQLSGTLMPDASEANFPRVEH